MYRYDWYIVPYVAGGDTYPTDTEKGDISAKDVNRILDNFFKTMRYLDNFKAKKVLKEIALQIIVEGCYYGYIEHTPTGPVLQSLPSEYCRSRYKKNNIPTVELNMKYFDVYYKDPVYRARVLKIFPEDVQGAIPFGWCDSCGMECYTPDARLCPECLRKETDYETSQ